MWILLTVESFLLFMFTQLSSHSISEMKIALVFVRTFNRLETIHCVVEPCRSCGGNFNDCQLQLLLDMEREWKSSKVLNNRTNKCNAEHMLKSENNEKRRIEQKKMSFHSTIYILFCHKIPIQGIKENYKNLSSSYPFPQVETQKLLTVEWGMKPLWNWPNLKIFLLFHIFVPFLTRRSELKLDHPFILLNGEASRLLCIFHSDSIYIPSSSWVHMPLRNPTKVWV